MKVIKKMEYFEIGSCFRTYSDLVKKLNKYNSDTKTKFFKKDSRFIATGFLNEVNRPLVYSEIRYNCIYKGPNGLKTSPEKNDKVECPAYFRLKLTEAGTALQIIAMNNRHNHPLEIIEETTETTDLKQETEIQNDIDVNPEKMNNVTLDIFIGQVFSTFDDLEEAIIKTCKEKSIQFYRRDSRKIESAVRRNSQKTYNPEIIYSEVKYACIYGGRKFKSKGVGVKKTKTFKKECPAYVKAVATNDGQQLIIKSICGAHNHPIVKGVKREISPIDSNIKRIRLRIESSEILPKAELPLPLEFIDVLIDEEHKPNVSFTFRGLCAPVFTVFNKDLSVNVEIIPEYANFLASKGIKGILVHGTSGEGMSMTVAERKSVVEEWVKAVKVTKQHVMVQVGGCPLPDVLELAKHAEQVGVDSLLCLPELYFKPSTPADLISYLKIVGEAAPQTPLLYYHIPGWSGVNINMAQFLNESVGKIPTFHGIKYTSNDLDGGAAALRANNGKYAVFLGADTLLAGAFAMGFDSAIATTLNILPEYSVQILEAIKANKVDEAREIQNRLTDACGIITKNGAWVPTMKIAMNLVTPINVGVARPPLRNLTTDHVNEMQRLLTAASVL